MPDDPMQYYLLTAHEAELIACYRMISEKAQEVIASMCASQAEPGRRIPDTPAKLSIVPKP